MQIFNLLAKKVRMYALIELMDFSKIQIASLRKARIIKPRRMEANNSRGQEDTGTPGCARCVSKSSHHSSSGLAVNFLTPFTISQILVYWTSPKTLWIIANPHAPDLYNIFPRKLKHSSSPACTRIFFFFFQIWERCKICRETSADKLAKRYINKTTVLRRHPCSWSSSWGSHDTRALVCRRTPVGFDTC